MVKVYDGMKGRWPGDAELTAESPARLIDWLNEHGVHGPHEEREERRLRTREERRWAAKWRSSIARSAKVPLAKMRTIGNGGATVHEADL